MRQWGQETAFIEAIFAAYWEENIGNIGESTVLASIAGELGVDPGEFEAACESQTVRDGLIESTDSALARGVFGAPSIMIDDTLYWGKDRMEFVEAQLAGAE